MKKDKWIWFSCITLYGALGIASIFLLCFRQAPANNHYRKASLYNINAELSKPEDSPVSIEVAETELIEEPSVELIVEPQTEVIQYSFITTNKLSMLHVRKDPGLTAEIIYYLTPQSSGDVIEKGEDWSLIQYEDITGYVSNDYLEFHEKN